jgi:hypothetical protein
VRLLDIYPANGEGTECGVDGPDECGVPIDATLTLRFDRFLDPATINRQAIRVFPGDPAFSASIPFDVAYDPVERVVEFRMPSGYAFQPRALYQVELVVAKGADAFGLRAFDGAPLSDNAGQRLSFLTSRLSEPLVQGEPPSCNDIVSQVFAPPLGNCASSECHRSRANALGAAPEALWLDGRANLRNTAINRVAHETELGDAAGVPLQDSPRFGVQMPLIDPNNPGNSYLLYKLLRKPENFEPCPPGASVSICDAPGDKLVSAYAKLPLPEGASVEPSAEESLRLREWFVRGEPMPYPRGPARSVSLQGLRAVSAFIAAGADCTD